jgi:radical SAM superfamily enzyme YgiQ (UPF0313 family)
VSANILLINANRCTTPFAVYPLGLSHIATALRQAGHQVELLDIQHDTHTIEARIQTCAPALIGISLRNIDDVQIDNTAYFVNDLIELVQRVRAVSHVPVCIGGSAFSLFPHQLMQQTCADFGVQGEGEEAVVALVKALQNNGPLDAIDGLLYRSGGEIRHNERRHLSPAAITPAHFEPRLAKAYLEQSSMLNVQTQRGCGFSCCYCTYPHIEGRKFRFREAGAVVDDMAAACAAGAGYLFIVDSIFNTSPQHVQAVCEEMVRRKISVPWCCFLRPQGLSDELMGLMKRAGLSHIEFGSDSFCDSVLQDYGKRFTFEDILESSLLAKRHEIWQAHYLILGGPGESEATLRQSFENSRRLPRGIIFPFTGMRLYPNTPLYERAILEGVISPGAELLKPFFYRTPALSRETIDGLMQEFSGASKMWFIPKSDSTPQTLMAQMYRRGFRGPLWEYLIV